MKITLEEIKSAALELSKEEQEALAMSILQNLETRHDSEIDLSWAKEGQSRLQAYRDGRLKSVDGPESVARVRKKLDEKIQASSAS